MRTSLLCLLAVVVSLQGCASVGRAGRGVSEGIAQTGLALSNRFSGDDQNKPGALPEISAPIPVATLSEVRIGDGVGEDWPKLSPAYAEDRVVTASASREEISAYSLADGALLWRKRLPEKVTGGVGQGNGLLLLGSREGRVYALSPQNGDVLWTGKVSSEVLAPPAGADGMVVVASGDGRLTGLSAVDGKRRWFVSRDVPALSLRGGAGPLIFGGLAIQGFANGHLVAAALNNGLEAWDATIAPPRGRTELERMVDVGSAPLERNGVVYAATYQGRVSATGAQSGEQIWSRELSCYAPLAADDFNLFATDADGKVGAFDLRTGLTYWEQAGLKGHVLTGPAVSGNFVAVGDAEGYVHFLRADNGELAARVRPTEDAFIFPAQVREGVFYFISASGRMYALRPGE